MTTLTQKPATKGQIRQISGLATDKYKDEEVDSEYGYLSGYNGADSMDQQFKVLQGLPVDVTGNSSVGESDFSASEGQFLVPNPEKFFKNHNVSVQSGLDMIKSSRGRLCNYREGQLGPNRLRRSARAEQAWKQIADAQGNPDILVVSAQFGLEHRGRSVRRAREVMIDSGQFGLGAYEVAMMLMTHPNRLEHFDDLWIDCAGDEYDDLGAGASFVRAPFFGFKDGKVEFGTFWPDSALDYCGSASGFLPQ